MANTPTTIFSGTTSPKGDQVGPDRIFNRAFLYLALFILFPVALLTYLLWLTLFVYARMPWWVPIPFAVVFWIIGFSIDGSIPGVVLGHFGMWGDLVKGARSSEGLGSWLAGNMGHVIAAQIMLAGIAGTTWAAIVSSWKWIRRPKWEERNLKPGPVLKRRAHKTAELIASGEDSPIDGVTVGVAIDLRDPRFAGGKPGAQYGKRVVLLDVEGAGHTLICGGSGSGKSTTMMVGMRDVIRRGHGLVVVDCKGGSDVPEQVAEWANRYGRDFLHWSMVGAKGYPGPADGPAYYDPIGRGDPSRRKDLIVGSQRWDVEYYKTVIGDYLQTAFTVIDLVPPPPGTDTLKDIADMLNPPSLLRRAVPIPRDKYPNLALALERIGSMGDQEKSGINNMYARLNTITSSIAGQWLRYDPEGLRDIDLLRCADEGQVVVFSLDSSNYEETSALLAGLIVQDLKTVSSVLRSEPAATPMHVYVDEFSAVDATNIAGLLAKARDAAMPVTLATQALADLKRREPHFDSQVIGIVSSFIIHRANTEEDARIYAGLSGMTRKMLHRIGVENTSGTLGTLGAAAASGSGFLEEKEMYRVDPGMFQGLHQGQCVMLAKIPDERYIAPVQVQKEDANLASRRCDPGLNPVRKPRHEIPMPANPQETYQASFARPWEVPAEPQDEDYHRRKGSGTEGAPDSHDAPVPVEFVASVETPVEQPFGEEPMEEEVKAAAPVRPGRQAPANNTSQGGVVRPIRPNLPRPGIQPGAPLPSMPGRPEEHAPIRKTNDGQDLSDEWSTL